MTLTQQRTAQEEKYLNEKREAHNGLSCQPVDNINHPPHYNSSQAKCECGRKIECIDVTRHLPFALGNAMKYLWRADLKGAPVEDLRKAIWYIQDEIKERIK